MAKCNQLTSLPFKGLKTMQTLALRQRLPGELRRFLSTTTTTATAMTTTLKARNPTTTSVVVIISQTLPFTGSVQT